MTSGNENIKQLEELLAGEGEGSLLVCYETGRDKPHAASSYQLYPVHPGQDGMTYQFLSLLHVGVETARISAFIPDTRMEVYRFPRMSALPPFFRDTPVKEYITGGLLPHIRENGLKPQVSVNLRDMVFIRSEGLPVEPGGVLRLDAGQIDRLTEFRRRQDELAARYKYVPRYKLPLRVIETPKGVLVFSGGDIGQKGIDSFYKFLLGNYFSIHMESGPVRQYRVDSPSARLYGLTDLSCRKEAGTNRYTFDPFDAYAGIGASEKKGWTLEFTTDMEPSDTEYRRLEDFSGCRPEGDNRDICRLLALRRHFDRDIILDPAFAYHFQFKEFVRRMDDCVNGLSKGDSMERILDEVREKSDRILRTDFRVRGYGTSDRQKGNRPGKAHKNSNRKQLKR